MSSGHQHSIHLCLFSKSGISSSPSHHPARRRRTGSCQRYTTGYIPTAYEDEICRLSLGWPREFTVETCIFFLLSGFWSDLTFSRLKQVQISYKSSFATFRHYLAHAINHTTQLPPQSTPKPKQTGPVLFSPSITSLVRSSLMNFPISMSSSASLFFALYLPFVIKLSSPDCQEEVWECIIRQIF